jgi:hypothetical protein
LNEYNKRSLRFDIQENGWVQLLIMGYNSLSSSAILATPILVADKWIAVNTLLPAAAHPKSFEFPRQAKYRLTRVELQTEWCMIFHHPKKKDDFEEDLNVFLS